MAVPAAAQDEVGPPPALVDKLTAAARDNLTSARLSDGSPAPAETTEELARPLVPRILEVQTIERALMSAVMATCQLDSEALSYRPYMQAIRASGRYSDKQIAYLGLLHGLSMGFLGSSLDAAMCNPDFVESLKQAPAETPIETP